MFTFYSASDEEAPTDKNEDAPTTNKNEKNDKKGGGGSPLKEVKKSSPSKKKKWIDLDLYGGTTSTTTASTTTATTKASPSRPSPPKERERFGAWWKRQAAKYSGDPSQHKDQLEIARSELENTLNAQADAMDQLTRKGL